MKDHFLETQKMCHIVAGCLRVASTVPPPSPRDLMPQSMANMTSEINLGNASTQYGDLQTLKSNSA